MRNAEGSTADELARRALGLVHETLLIDEEWTTRSKDGFSWLAWRLRQSFRSGMPFVHDGHELIRVSAATVVVDGVRVDGKRVVDFLGMFNRFTVGEALLWDASERSIVSNTAVVLHEPVLEWRIKELSANAILALAAAEIRGESYVAPFAGQLARREHPDHGPRVVADDMLNVVRDAFAPAGSGASEFAQAEEFREIEAIVRDGPFFTAGGSESGIAVEFAFGNDDTSLLHMRTDQQHPWLGSGLLATLKVRLPAHLRLRAADAAGYLNALEARGDYPYQSAGAWCVEHEEPERIIAHAHFVPNALYQSGISRDVLFSGINRALWVADVLLADGDAVRRDATTIAHERLFG